MTTLQEMIAQKEALEKQIEEATSHGRNEAIAKVKALMAEHGLKLSDLGGQGWQRTEVGRQGEDGDGGQGGGEVSERGDG